MDSWTGKESGIWAPLLELLKEVEKLEEEKRVLTSALNESHERSNHLDTEIIQGQRCEMMNDEKISSLVGRIEKLEEVSYDGVLNVDISDYSQKKAAARAGAPTSFYSDDFYTDHHGYRMCARIYLNGDGIGKDTHLSIFFALKKGKYDNYLPWPFQRRVTFSLLNQAGKDHLSDAFRPDPTSPSFQKPIKEMNIASGFPLFVAHKLIEDLGEGFLRNDTIQLQVKVDPPTCN